MMYKITFYLNSPISFIETPVFDSLIAYCYMKEYYSEKIKFRSLFINETELFDFRKVEDFPIKLSEDKSYFIASYMFYNKEQAINYTESYKKRWCNKYDFIADFGKNKRQIKIDSGRFKSYDMPINVYSLEKVWFFFDSDNIKELEYLITKHLYGIGKKTSQGYGEIKNIEIEKIEINPFNEIIRPIPISNFNLSEEEKTKLMIEGKIKMSCYYPPYWDLNRLEFCLCE